MSLEASGEGYISPGVEGIAAKVLLEQAQEAAELARQRLEKAATLHNQVRTITRRVSALKERQLRSDLSPFPPNSVRKEGV